MGGVVSTVSGISSMTWGMSVANLEALESPTHLGHTNQFGELVDQAQKFGMDESRYNKLNNLGGYLKHNCKDNKTIIKELDSHIIRATINRLSFIREVTLDDALSYVSLIDDCVKIGLTARRTSELRRLGHLLLSRHGESDEIIRFGISRLLEASSSFL